MFVLIILFFPGGGAKTLYFSIAFMWNLRQDASLQSNYSFLIGLIVSSKDNK